MEEDIRKHNFDWESITNYHYKIKNSSLDHKIPKKYFNYNTVGSDKNYPTKRWSSVHYVDTEKEVVTFLINFYESTYREPRFIYDIKENNIYLTDYTKRIYTRYENTEQMEDDLRKHDYDSQLLIDYYIKKID